ncbi:MAG: DUF6493 family protein, partial [Bacteroidota bacterium]
CPSNPEKFMAILTRTCFKEADFFGEDDKRSSIKLLEYLLEYPLSFGKMTQLFLASSITCADKTARALAAEVLSKGIQQGLVDAKVLGTCLGKQFRIGFAPLKRFTDLLSEQLLRISKRQDQFLLEMLGTALAYADRELPRGFKRLLEIYTELQRKYKAELPEKVSENFSLWETSQSLKKITQLLKQQRAQTFASA